MEHFSADKLRLTNSPRVPDDLGVVVLGYGPHGGDEARRLLLDLNEQGVASDQVTVVWNMGVEASMPGVSVVLSKQNLGYAGGMNIGIRQQLERGRRLILLLTMDVHLTPGSIARLCSAADAAPSFGLLGPVTRHLPDFTFWGLTWSRTGVTTAIVAAPSDDDHDGIVECDSIDGAVFLIRREVLEKIGLLLDRFFMYYEETEYCLRAKRAGWRVGVVLGAMAEHVPGGSRRIGAYEYLAARNGLEFARILSGTVGVVGAFYRYGQESINLLMIRLNSDPSRRNLAGVRLTGMWRGMLAFLGRRWGPPPADLPGVGDISLSPP